MADAIYTALENREVILCRVCVSIPANILVYRVNDRPMASELLTDRPIDGVFVRSEMGVLGNRVDDDSA
jgi:hypothetical protein